MSLYVVDACVAIKWYLPEEETASALRVLDAQHQLHAPDFLLLETDNILCKRIRRGDVTPDRADEIRKALRQAPIILHAATARLNRAYDIAVRTGRSLYDCLYVALAVLLEGQMVTADRRLFESLATGPFGKHVVWVGQIEVRIDRPERAPN
jgi:predicted nucleic acid-binding protein